VPGLTAKRRPSQYLAPKRLPQSRKDQIYGVGLVYGKGAQIFEQVFRGNPQAVLDRLILAHLSQRRCRRDRGHTACCTKPAADDRFVLHSQLKAGQIPTHRVLALTPVSGVGQLPAMTKFGYELPDSR